MNPQLLHIFRNTPLGRETLLQSLYFCVNLDISPVIYLPDFLKFLMYFENDAVQIDLNDSYLTSPKTARRHATELAEQAGIKPQFIEPKNFTSPTLPDMPTHFDFMCCPSSISDLSSKIGLGYIGSRVRRIVRSAQFPLLIPSPVYKPWNSIAVFFGGAANAVNALRLGFRISRISGKPLDVFTQAENQTREVYEKAVRDAHLEEEMSLCLNQWHIFESGAYEENLYKVPHNALVIMGIFDHSLIKDMIFGSKAEKVQSLIPNNLLVVGPKYRGTT